MHNTNCHTHIMKSIRESLSVMLKPPANVHTRLSKAFLTSNVVMYPSASRFACTFSRKWGEGDCGSPYSHHVGILHLQPTPNPPSNLSARSGCHIFMPIAGNGCRPSVCTINHYVRY